MGGHLFSHLFAHMCFRFCCRVTTVRYFPVHVDPRARPAAIPFKNFTAVTDRETFGGARPRREKNSQHFPRIGSVVAYYTRLFVYRCRVQSFVNFDARIRFEREKKKFRISCRKKRVGSSHFFSHTPDAQHQSRESLSFALVPFLHAYS